MYPASCRYLSVEGLRASPTRQTPFPQKVDAPHDSGCLLKYIGVLEGPRPTLLKTHLRQEYTDRVELLLLPKQVPHMYRLPLFVPYGAVLLTPVRGGRSPPRCFCTVTLCMNVRRLQ